jgi:DNA-binding MarR family transcriptional regulator
MGCVTTRRSQSKAAAAADVWRLMMQHLQAQWGRAAGLLQKAGLTPGHFKVLLVLSSGEAKPMGELAGQLACDASTMTWLVDRLEERGLVERRPSPDDRRVKTIVLTEAGRAQAEELQAQLYEPPKELLDLDRDALDAIHDVFSRLAATIDHERPFTMVAGPRARA